MFPRHHPQVSPRAGHSGALVGSTWYLLGGGNNVNGEEARSTAFSGAHILSSTLTPAKLSYVAWSTLAIKRSLHVGIQDICANTL